MKTSRLLLLCILLSFSVGIAFSSQFQLLAPDHISHPSLFSLDDEQPDTIAYDDGSSSVFWNGNDYFARVQFTVPSSFELRSVYFYTTNQPMSADPCSVWVHAADNGNLGEVLSVYVQNGMVDGGWNDGNLPTPVTFNPGEVFNVVLGPVPGGLQNENYAVMIDSNPTGHSSLSRDGHYAVYDPAVPGDYMIRAGGESGGPFVDISSRECWNTINGGDPSFNIFEGDVVQLHAQVANTGTIDSVSFNAEWTITGPGGLEVSLGTSPVENLRTNTNVELSAPQTFTPNLPGEYLASCVVSHAEDQLVFNNIARLRFFVGDLPRWFRYDDDQYDSHIGLNQNAAHGVAFTPIRDRCKITDLRVHFSNFGDAVLAIHLIDESTTLPNPDPVWIDTLAVDSMEWTTLDVDPAVYIFEGRKFVVAAHYSGEDLALGKDDSPPNQAGNTHMSGVGWSLEGGVWFEDTGGNWCLQAYLDTSNVLPPYPILETDTDQLAFGNVTIDSTSTMSFWIRNDGNTDDLVISGFAYTPPSYSNIYVFDQTQYTIAAGESLEVSVAFSPVAEVNYNGRVDMLNNSENDPSHRILLVGAGVQSSATDDQNSGLPANFALAQNYPNPFNPSTKIEFALPQQADVQLTVFNTLGQEVARLFNGTVEAGYHSITFNSTDLSAGLYFYKLEAGSFVQTRKMMLLK